MSSAVRQLSYRILWFVICVDAARHERVGSPKSLFSHRVCSLNNERTTQGGQVCKDSVYTTPWIWGTVLSQGEKQTLQVVSWFPLTSCTRTQNFEEKQCSLRTSVELYFMTHEFVGDFPRFCANASWFTLKAAKLFQVLIDSDVGRTWA